MNTTTVKYGIIDNTFCKVVINDNTNKIIIYTDAIKLFIDKSIYKLFNLFVIEDNDLIKRFEQSLQLCRNFVYEITYVANTFIEKLNHKYKGLFKLRLSINHICLYKKDDISFPLSTDSIPINYYQLHNSKEYKDFILNQIENICQKYLK